MALILEKANAKRKVWRTIKVEVPSDTNSGYIDMKFDVQFQLMEAEDIQDKKEEQITDFLKSVIKDVRGVKAHEDDEDDVTFSSDLVDQLVAIPWIRAQLMKEYLLIPAGKKGRSKN